MIQFKALNRIALQSYIYSEAYYTAPFLPISQQRALSHIANPAATDEDILLILVLENEVLVGYLGILPDTIHVSETQIDKFGWLSCLWIDDSQRGKGLAKQLVQKAFEYYDFKIAVRDFTPEAKKIYDKTGQFNDLLIKYGIRLYLRADFKNLLPPRKGIWAKLLPLWRITDKCFNFIFDNRFFLYKYPLSKLKIQYTHSIDSEMAAFIAKHNTNDLFKRNADELNWVLRYPWLLEMPAADEWSKKYHFSYYNRSFANYTLRITNQKGQIVGCMLFSKRDDNLKLPYCFYEKEYIDEIVRIILQINIHLNISTFTVYHTEIVKKLQEMRTPAFYKKTIKKHVILGKIFNLEHIDNIYTNQDGDGDGAFT